MTTALDHLTTLQQRQPELLAAAVRRVRVHACGGTALLVRDALQTTVSAVADDTLEVQYEVSHSDALVDAVQRDDPAAAALVIAAWFEPATWWTLRRRRARDWLLSLGVEVDNVVHFTLPHNNSTLLHLNAEWLWVPGHRGIASRHFTLATEQQLEWLTQTLRATNSQDDLFWSWFTEWYTDFCERTSTLTLNEERQQRLVAQLARYEHTDEPETVWEGWEDW